MNILITGGAGYIGTHILTELAATDHTIIVVDNFSNSSRHALERVEQITGQYVYFYKQDVSEKNALRRIFLKHPIDAVIHLAGLKAVGESVEQPIKYYRNNIDSTLALCEVMDEFTVNKLIFSSSATVYGTPETLPFTEESPTGQNITNPYGQTKYMIEQILSDWAKSDPRKEVTILRYFNPIGAHESGLIGEDPNGIPNNLVPFVSQVAVGRHDHVKVFGNTYKTHDGTGVRDYIHVVDLTKGHVAALNHLRPGLSVYNLGTGKGSSVLEVIAAFGQASEKDIPYKIASRREGDIAMCYASAKKAETELGWKAEKSLLDACHDAWRWQYLNPQGYGE